MDKIKFDNTFDLVISIKGLLDNIDTDYPVISVYGKYDVIKDILEDLIASGVSIANEIELQDYDVAHYNKEFVLYLTKNGVNVEKTWHEDVYYCGSADISFVHEDCSSKLIKYVDSKTVYEFGYNEDNDENCDCDECECACKKDEKPATASTTKSKSTYRVNGEEVDKDTFESALSDIEDRYLNNVRDMLLGYCEIMDEVNDWRSRFLCW